MNRLSQLLAKYGLSQRSLAKTLGMSQQHMNQMVLGKSAPSLERAKKISSYFRRKHRVKVDVVDLMEGRDGTVPQTSKAAQSRR